jgi:plasmid stability protein
MTDKTTTLNIRKFPEQLRRDLKAEAARQGKSTQELVIEILRKGLKSK